MSNLIDTRYQRSRKDWLLQQPLNAFGSVSGNSEFVQGSYLSKDVYGLTRSAADTDMVGIGAVGSALAMLLGFDGNHLHMTAGSACMVIHAEHNSPITVGATLIEDSSVTDHVEAKWVSGRGDIWSRFWSTMSRELKQKPAIASKTLLTAGAKLRVERLNRIQAALSLSIQDFAAVLKVSRAWLYKWFDESKSITLQETSRQRLAEMERLAALWQKRTSTPLSSIAHEPLDGGRSVLDLLSADALDEKAILNAFDNAAAMLSGMQKSLGKRMAEAGFTRRRPQRLMSDDE